MKADVANGRKRGHRSDTNVVEAATGETAEPFPLRAFFHVKQPGFVEAKINTLNEIERLHREAGDYTACWLVQGTREDQHTVQNRVSTETFRLTNG